MRPLLLGLCLPLALLALDASAHFLVLDRGGPGANCDETPLPGVWTLRL